MVSTKCSKICQICLFSTLSEVKTVKDIYCLQLSAVKTVKDIYWSQLSAVKTVKDIYCQN